MLTKHTAQTMVANRISQMVTFSISMGVLASLLPPWRPPQTPWDGHIRPEKMDTTFPEFNCTTSLWFFLKRTTSTLSTCYRLQTTDCLETLTATIWRDTSRIRTLRLCSGWPEMTSTKFPTGRDAKLKNDIYFFECKEIMNELVEFIFQFKKWLILWVDFETKRIYFEMYILMEIMSFFLLK